MYGYGWMMDFDFTCVIILIWMHCTYGYILMCMEICMLLCDMMFLMLCDVMLCAITLCYIFKLDFDTCYDA